MTERENDDTIVDLTEVVEEGAGIAGGTWEESVSPPEKEAKPPAPPQEKKVSEPPKIPRGENPSASSRFDEIPESPLKKFLLAEDEPASRFTPSPPQPPERPQGFTTPGPQSLRPAVAAARVPPEPPKPTPEPARAASEPPRAIPEPPRLGSEPFRPPLPSIDAEMRSLREAMLNRVEKWVAQEGTQVLERVAREIFPRAAEEIIRREIEKLKKEAEESE